MTRVVFTGLAGMCAAVVVAWWFWSQPQPESRDASVTSRPAAAGFESATEEEMPEAGFALERNEWYRRLRSRPDGTFPRNAMEQARAQHARLKAAAPRVADAGIDSMSWEELGPGNIGGRIRSIVIHPTRTNEMLIGSVSGGIWKSTDGGASWRPVNDFLKSLSIGCMALDPSDPEVVYAGTGELVPGWYSPSLGTGIFKSTNFGDNWDLLADTDGWQYVNSIVVHPTDGDVVLAARDVGLFRSIDGGMHWDVDVFGSYCDVSFDPGGSGAAVAGGCSGGTALFYDLTAMPSPRWRVATMSGNPAMTTLTAAVVPDADFAADTLQVASSAGFRVNDTIRVGPMGGSVVTTVASVPNASSLTVNRDFGTGIPSGSPVVSLIGGTFGYEGVELAYARSSPNLVYAVINMAGGTLWRSDDGGQSYNFVSRIQHVGGQGQYNNAIWVDPSNGNRLVAGGVQMRRSLDGGLNWRQIDYGAHADQHRIVEHPQYNGTTNKMVFLGNDGGLFRTNDILRPIPTTACATNADCADGEVCIPSEGMCNYADFGWQELNNQLSITQFVHVDVDGTTGKILGGSQDTGTVRYVPSSCNGNGTCDDGEDCMVCPSDCPDTGGCTPGSGFEGWDTFVAGDGGFCAIDPTDSSFLYGEYVRARVDRGINGRSVQQYIHAQNIADANGGCASIQLGDLIDACCSNALFYAPFLLDPNSSNRLLVGATRLWRTNNAKAMNPFWQIIKNPVSAVATNAISAIDVAKDDSDVIWVGHVNGEVFMTTNGTAPNPTSPPCTPCLICPPYPMGSTCPNCPTGPNWVKVSTNPPGLPAQPVTRIRIDPNDNNRVYVTFGGFIARSVWKTDNAGLSWVPIMGTAPQRLPADQMNTIQIHPQQPGWLYVGSDIALYTSQDDGRTWSASNDGPANVIINDLAWANTNELYAVTHGRGVFKTGPIVPDCDGNGTPDYEELAGDDCNGNERLDRCEPDCDGNGQPDDCDLASAVANFVRRDDFFAEEDPSSIVAADFNDDSFDDLAVANVNGPSISVLINRGNAPDGTWLGFAASVNYPTPICDVCPPDAIPGLPWALTVSDLDHDGSLDIAYVFESGDILRRTSDLDVLLNNGDGTFVRVTSGPMVRDVGAFRSLAIAAGDLDGDTFDEIVVASTESATGVGQFELTVIFNDGLDDMGHWLGLIPPFLPAHFLTVGRGPTSLAIGRFNPDGPLDIASANADDGNVSVLINDGTGAFASAVQYAIGGTPSSIVARDVNDDGVDDLAVAAGLASVFVLTNAGDGTFGAATPYDSGLALTEALASDDFDLDGSPDLAFGARLILNSATGVFGAPFPIAGGVAVSLATGDLDADGDRDLAGVAGTGRTVWVVRNDSLTDCNDNGVPDGCDIAAGMPDSDGDGLLDECETGACDQDGDGDCDLEDYRRVAGCWRGPDVPCETAVAGGVPLRSLDGDFDFDLRDFAIVQNEFSASRNCCEHHGPGCRDFPVQHCVCAQVPECCAEAWTRACVTAVTTLNCGDCEGGPNCGDGICDSHETCASCDRDCGPCEEDCCTMHESIGCDMNWVQTCVCRARPECCHEGWDVECVAIAGEACGGCCGNGACDIGESCRTCPTDCVDCPPSCGDGFCGVGESCEGCPRDCGTCPVVCGDGRCNGSEDCATCREDCGPCQESCCLSHDTPGCNNPNIEGCVCSFLPECCQTAWTELCATSTMQCGACIGSCCEVQQTPGCFDLTVAECVCAVTPDCCDVAWTANCVGLVESLGCSACP